MATITTTAAPTLSDFYFSDSTETICGQSIPSICNDFVAESPSVVDRFFTRYYYRRPHTKDEDHLILFHTNRICLVGLAPRHVALSKGVRSINYNIGNCDRSQNLCSGKGKRGAMNLQPHSALAVVTTDDGTEYKVMSCITAKLIEVNASVVTNPAIISKEGDGYVAICLPKPDACDKIKESLLTQQEYDELCFNDDKCAVME